MEKHISLILMYLDLRSA